MFYLPIPLLPLYGIHKHEISTAQRRCKPYLWFIFLWYSRVLARQQKPRRSDWMSCVRTGISLFFAANTAYSQSFWTLFGTIEYVLSINYTKFIFLSGYSFSSCFGVEAWFVSINPCARRLFLWPWKVLQFQKDSWNYKSPTLSDLCASISLLRAIFPDMDSQKGFKHRKVTYYYGRGH